jgi:ribosomal protein S18 acetylase RimI-like enzyme/Flp pilus assembly protein protease CpaA
MSLLVLVTPTRRVEREHALATVVVRDPLALAVWVALWLLLTTFGVAGTVVTALERWPLAWAVLPVVVGAVVVASAATAQRVDAWWCWRRHGNVLVIANVAVDRDGAGHGDELLRDLGQLADAVGRALVLRVDPRNNRAVHLYRRHGFEALDAEPSPRMRMVRSPRSAPGVPAAAPSWLAPAAVSVPALAVGVVVGVLLTGVYWGTPAAWLLVPFGVLGAVAADCDLRWLRIPNRMLASGVLALVALVLVVGWWFDAPMVGTAVAGAAIAGAPLFAQHVVTGGRSPGLGDAKLAAAVGLVAGAIYPAVAIAGLLVSVLLGVVFGLLWQRRWRRGPGFPLAPALVAGMAVAVAIWAPLGGATTW